MNPLRRRIAALALLAYPAAPAAQVHNSMQGRSFKSGSTTLMYRLFVPKNYDPGRKYPLMTAMHGVGEKGADNNIQADREDLASTWIDDTLQTRVPHFVMVPQCPTDLSWGAAAAIQGVHGIIDSLKREFSLDTNRLYVAGLSMGARGTFNRVQARPGYFAAALPCAGAGDNAGAAAIARTPLWIFHGTKDPTVDISGSRTMVAAIEQTGIRFIRFTSQTAFAVPGLNTYRDARRNGTPVADLGTKNIVPSLDSLRKAVAGGADYLYQEVTDGDHRTGWMAAFHHPLVTTWIYSKSKGSGPVTLAPRPGRPGRKGARLETGALPAGNGFRAYTPAGRRLDARAAATETHIPALILPITPR